MLQKVEEIFTVATKVHSEAIVRVVCLYRLQTSTYQLAPQTFANVGLARRES